MCCRNWKSKKWPQEEQEMKEQNWMTDEMKMFQRITTKDATPKQVSNSLA